MSSIVVAVQTPTQPNLKGWGDYRNEVNLYLENKKKEPRPAHWSTREPFYLEVHAQLSAVYRAWRNPTMHMEKTYTQDHAQQILEASKALMVHSASHLDEGGNWLA